MTDTHPSHSEAYLARPTIRRPILLNYGFSGDFEDQRACSAAIRRGSKSFHLASLLLPGPTREAARALYAFCRHSDDLIDDPRSGMPALQRLRERLDLIYAGAPAPFACDRAFARVVHDHAIAKPVVEALLDGFAMDLDGRRHATIDDVKAYATCVAASVGLMMASVMGVSDRAALSRAADLGIAMQLTNIARDVGEDARNGRLYLPLDWLEEQGVDVAAFLHNPQFTPALGLVVRRLLDEAARHYRLGHAGIRSLPKSCRHAIRTAALVYEAIGQAIAANGYDSVNHRATTGLSTKLGLLIKARSDDSRWTATAVRDLHAGTEPVARSLVTLSGILRESAPTQRPDTPASDGETAVGRVTDILLRLHADARIETLRRRDAAREKAASLA
ncbi:phytoene/squalene synthase family protein [Agrobacterium sp. RAC06]|uniref:phytoene/squalene synthase family protein n=1 Tax=Agrobacterium sp. RAC06 TaxID=1842536 RepID=UPI00083D858E|nr:phytoene/squalene synthase family protein [Agrobacterium sp. RAC06]AOG11598.1 squalene/phytoene synthase family protein [Agrobacterium sp. RAC06]